MRFITPEPVAGWMVVIVAGIALAVDVFTALLTYSQSKTSMNIKAAFLHNVTDALASVGVIIAGTLILLYGWVWTDAAMTLLISVYVLYQGFTETPKVIHLLMEGAPKGLNMQNVTSVMEAVEGVLNVHHVHVWQLDEHRNALEAHVVLEKEADMDALKKCLKKLLQDKFEIEHSTLEFENNICSSHSDLRNV
jgi:cobalt-zinc-cadmium efflux system protein